jgi:hypothetical protein
MIMTSDETLRQWYGEDEVLAALGELSQADIDQMLGFVRFRLIGNAARPGYVEVEDLFIDAVIRTMLRKRTWARGVGVFNHFFAVMRSIGHQRFKQAGRGTPLSECVAASHDWSPSALDARTTLARLKEQLSGDGVALSVLESMKDEVRPFGAQQSLGITADVYWAARKRIRRSAERLAGAPVPKRRVLTATNRR